MSDKYGFIPVGDLTLPVVDKDNASIDDVMRLHKNVSLCKNHNFLGAQIHIEYQLNSAAWQKYLKEYWDQQLCYLIKYGFPLDFNSDNPLKHGCINHSSAKLHSEDVKAYIAEEK